MLDKELVRQMHANGSTMRELASIFGVSYQRIAQVCSGMFERKHVRVQPNAKIIYKGIQNWLFEKQITYKDLAKLLGYQDHSTTVTRISAKLSGNTELKISDIKKLLALSGMTFEEAFMEG